MKRFAPSLMAVSRVALATLLVLLARGESRAVADHADRVSAVIAAAPRDHAKETPPPKPAVPPCLIPQGEPIPAQRIMQDLAAGRAVDLQGRIIDGSLDAEAIGHAPDERRTSLRILNGRLKLDACRITGRVSLPRTVLTQGLVLTCSEIVGDIDLSDSMVDTNVVLDRSRILGDLRLSHTTVEGDVSLKGATLEGSVEASGGRIANLLMGYAEVHRDLSISHEVMQSLDLSAAQLNGTVKLDDVLVVSTVLMRGARIGRSVNLDTVRIASMADFNESVPTGGISATNLTIEGSLMLSISGDFPLGLQDVTVGQNLVMVDGVFGEVSIQRLRVRAGSDMQGSRFMRKLFVADTDFGGIFSASESRFEGETEFRNVRFAGMDPMSGALFASAPILVDTVLPVPPTLMGDEGAGDEEGDPGDEGDDEPPSDKP